MIKQANNQKEPLVAISLLNWLNYTDTINCVGSLSLLNYSNFVLLIRDNASPNDSFERLKEAFPNLIIERSTKNNGFAAGHYDNYLLAKEKKADLFWILNSDLEVDTQAFDFLIDAYLNDSNCIYGSVSLIPEKQDLIDFGGAPVTEKSSKVLTYNTWKGQQYSNLKTEHPESYEVESVEGSSMLIPMKVIEEHGFMKTDFFMYGEETDYCYRMRKQGVKSFVVTQSIVKHHNEGSTQHFPSLKIIPAYYRRRNVLRFSIDHLGMTRWEALSYQDGVYQNLKTFLKGLFSKEKEMSYFYALGCIHAFLCVKGKRVEPEKLIK